MNPMRDETEARTTIPGEEEMTPVTSATVIVCYSLLSTIVQKVAEGKISYYNG